jgi:hypothetical protein
MARLTVDRRAGVRGALLHTLPGRVIVVGVALKLAVLSVITLLGTDSPFLNVVDRVAGLAAAVGASYFLVQLILLAKRRLLWRVRRKMMISYLFIGSSRRSFLPPSRCCAASCVLTSARISCSAAAVAERSRRIRRAERRARDSACRRPGCGRHHLAPPGDRPIRGVGTSDRRSAGGGLHEEVRSGSQKSEALQTSAQASNFSGGGPWSHANAQRAGRIGCSAIGRPVSHKKMSAGDDADTHLLVRSVAFPIRRDLDTPSPSTWSSTIAFARSSAATPASTSAAHGNR